MKCQILFSGKNKKHIYFSSAIFAHSTISVTTIFVSLVTVARMHIRLVTRRLRVQSPPGQQHSFMDIQESSNIFYGLSLFSPDSRRAVVSFW